MVDRKYNFLIEGQPFDETGLRSLCLEKISALGTPYWERDIWTFILKWLSPEKIIEVNTSGSTGNPKLITLQKKHMVQSAMASISFFGMKPGKSALLALPVNYIAGKMMVVRALVGKLNLLFVEPTSCPVVDNFREIGFAAMTPMQLINLLKTEPLKVKKIKKLIVGGSALPLGLENELQHIQTEIWQTYGMTETITHIAVRKVNGPDRSAFYHCLPGVTITADERGCLQVDYPKIGVHHQTTNDMVEIGKSGQFRILGRIDNTVNSGGIKLFPEAIEKKIEGLIKKDYYLGAVPDNVLGERLVLFIEGTPLEDHQRDILMSNIKQQLHGFEIPKEIVFKSSFDRTPNGKIIRK